MKIVHCPWCSQETKVNASGRVVPHRSEAARCVGSGAPEEDLHARTAAELSVSRRTAKAINFTRLYGSS